VNRSLPSVVAAESIGAEWRGLKKSPAGRQRCRERKARGSCRHGAQRAASVHRGREIHWTTGPGPPHRRLESLLEASEV